MQRRGDEALLGQTPEGIEAAAAGKRNSFGIAEGDIAGAARRDTASAGSRG